MGCTFKFIQLHHRELEWSYVVYDVWHVVDLTDILYSLSTIVIFEWKLQWKLFTWKLWNIPQIKYVSIKFIALYIYSIFKNIKISNNYLMKHEITLQIFISFNSKFHRLIKCDDRFVYYIIFTLWKLWSYRLVSIFLGFASEASSVSYFTLYLDESCFSFTNRRDFRKMIENQRPSQPKVNISPCSSKDNIFALYIPLLRHCSGNFITLW